MGKASRPTRICSSSTRPSTSPAPRPPPPPPARPRPPRTARRPPRRRAPPRPPQPVPAFGNARDIWTAIRAGDVLVHHPYHAFDAVTRFVRDAAVDPKVLAIKMTLYRVSPASPIAHALRTAVENGKEVT